jgi:hypothetical protein
MKETVINTLFWLCSSDGETVDAYTILMDDVSLKHENEMREEYKMN